VDPKNHGKYDLASSTQMEYTPPVNVIQNDIGTGWAMYKNKVFLHPCHKVVLKHALDDLMEKVWCKKFIDVCMREPICKGLNKW
jgi:hypothetical protein